MKINPEIQGLYDLAVSFTDSSSENGIDISQQELEKIIELANSNGLTESEQKFINSLNNKLNVAKISIIGNSDARLELELTDDSSLESEASTQEIKEELIGYINRGININAITELEILTIPETGNNKIDKNLERLNGKLDDILNSNNWTYILDRFEKRTNEFEKILNSPDFSNLPEELQQKIKLYISNKFQEIIDQKVTKLFDNINSIDGIPSSRSQIKELKENIDKINQLTSLVDSFGIKTVLNLNTKIQDNLNNYLNYLNENINLSNFDNLSDIETILYQLSNLKHLFNTKLTNIDFSILEASVNILVNKGLDLIATQDLSQIEDGNSFDKLNEISQKTETLINIGFEFGSSQFDISKIQETTEDLVEKAFKEMSDPFLEKVNSQSNDLEVKAFKRSDFNEMINKIEQFTNNIGVLGLEEEYSDVIKTFESYVFSYRSERLLDWGNRNTGNEEVNSDFANDYNREISKFNDSVQEINGIESGIISEEQLLLLDSGNQNVRITALQNLQEKINVFIDNISENGFDTDQLLLIAEELNKLRGVLKNTTEEDEFKTIEDNFKSIIEYGIETANLSGINFQSLETNALSNPDETKSKLEIAIESINLTKLFLEISDHSGIKLSNSDELKDLADGSEIIINNVRDLLINEETSTIEQANLDISKEFVGEAAEDILQSFGILNEIINNEHINSEDKQKLLKVLDYLGNFPEGSVQQKILDDLLEDNSFKIIYYSSLLVVSGENIDDIREAQQRLGSEAVIKLSENYILQEQNLDLLSENPENALKLGNLLEHVDKVEKLFTDSIGTIENILDVREQNTFAGFIVNVFGESSNDLRDFKSIIGTIKNNEIDKLIDILKSGDLIEFESEMKKSIKLAQEVIRIAESKANDDISTAESIVDTLEFIDTASTVITIVAGGGVIANIGKNAFKEVVKGGSKYIAKKMATEGAEALTKQGLKVLATQASRAFVQGSKFLITNATRAYTAYTIADLKYNITASDNPMALENLEKSFDKVWDHMDEATRKEVDLLFSEQNRNLFLLFLGAYGITNFMTADSKAASRAILDLLGKVFVGVQIHVIEQHMIKFYELAVDADTPEKQDEAAKYLADAFAKMLVTGGLVAGGAAISSTTNTLRNLPPSHPLRTSVSNLRDRFTAPVFNDPVLVPAGGPITVPTRTNIGTGTTINIAEPIITAENLISLKKGGGRNSSKQKPEINPNTGREINPRTGRDINSQTGNDINPLSGRDIKSQNGKEFDIDPNTGSLIDVESGMFVNSRNKPIGHQQVEALRSHNNIQDARSMAREEIGALGTGAERTEVRMFEHTPKELEGLVNGAQSADGKRGWRLDYDPDKGIHFNWYDWTNGKKGQGGKWGAETFPGTHDDYVNLLLEIETLM